MTPDITVCLSFDFDAMSVWIQNFRTDSPNALSRGEFGRVGAGRTCPVRGAKTRSASFVHALKSSHVREWLEAASGAAPAC